MLYSDLITLLRADLNDNRSNRWTDAKLLQQIGRALRRLNHLLYRNDVELARGVYSITCSAGQEAYDLPADYMVDVGLFRTDTGRALNKESETSWHILQAPGELQSYIVRGYQVLVAGLPLSSVPLAMVYYPIMGDEALSLTDETPWDGKLDDLIVEYAAYRLRNIDEMDQTPDSQILADLENQILSTYSAVSPLVTSRPGWVS